jgi:hypothetical protein
VKLYLSSEQFEKTTHLVTKTRDKILNIQADQIAKVDKLVTNYKKDSKDRKTQTYLNKKLEDLEAKWEKCLLTHDALKIIPDRSDQYFNDDVFQRYKKIYLETKLDIEQLLKKIPNNEEKISILKTLNNNND